jgi:uncharacterized protein YdeI (YjbR/CyaY-like superfamily)
LFCQKQKIALIRKRDAAALDVFPEVAAFFATLKGANRYAILYRISTAKRPETRARRIAEFVAMLQRGETVFHG